MPHEDRRRRIGALVLIATMALVGCDSVEERVSKHYARGMELIEQEKYETAAIEFRNAIRLDDKFTPARLEIAKLYERDGELRAALGNYRAVADGDPQNIESRLKIAQFLLMGGDLDGAAGFADEALAIDAQNAEALAVAAAIAYRQDDPERAVELAESALASDPMQIGANVVIIRRQIDQDDAAGALARIDSLLEQAPADRSLNMVKLEILQNQGDLEGLGAHLQRMTGIFPEERSLKTALARWHISRGDYPAAEAQLRAIAAEDPNDAELALEVARFVAASRGRDAAREELLERIAAAPDAETAFTFQSALASLNYSEGRGEEARTILEEASTAGGAIGRSARLQLARFALSEGQREQARTLLDGLIAEDEGNTEARALRAALLIDADDPDAALADINVALDADQQNAQVLTLAAQAYERTGNQALAGERHAAATRASGFAPEIAIRYADFLVRNNRLDAAETVLVEAERRNFGDSGVLLALAETRLRQENWSGVSEVVAKLRETEDGVDAARRLEAASLSRQGRNAESISILEDMMGEEGEDVATLTALVSAHLREGEIERARGVLEDRLARMPGDTTALLLMAETHAVDGDLAQAEESLRAAIAAAPDNYRSYAGLARLKLFQGEREQAFDALETGVAAVQDSRPLRLILAQLYEQDRDFDAAIEQYQAIYDIDPSSIVVANNLASLLAEHKADDPGTIARAAAIARRLNGSTVPEFQDTLGWIQYLQGDYSAALRNLLPASRERPNNAWVRYHVGMTYAKLGRAADARENLEMALSLDPSFPRAEEISETISALQAAELQ